MLEQPQHSHRQQRRYDASGDTGVEGTIGQRESGADDETEETAESEQTAAPMSLSSAMRRGSRVQRLTLEMPRQSLQYTVTVYLVLCWGCC